MASRGVMEAVNSYWGEETLQWSCLQARQEAPGTLLLGVITQDGVGLPVIKLPWSIHQITHC